MRVIDLLNKIANGELAFEQEFKHNGFITDMEMFNNEYLLNEEILNNKIEIIEEVEDKEYKDIEELKIECMENQPSSKYIVDEYGKKCFLTKHSKIIADKVNELVRNQKYILERLDK